jgi:Zn finger protein HypA/HybF involved in hydrogenase expression
MRCRSARAAFRCIECRRVSAENERGWTARLTIDDEVVVYCPECDEREFGIGADE